MALPAPNYPGATWDGNEQDTANDPGAEDDTIAEARDYNLTSAEMIAVIADLRAAFATESVADMEAALVALRASITAQASHSTQHKHGGADEVASSAPGANLIPKAVAGGTLSTGWLPAATELAPGALEIATQVETQTGIDDTKAITPAKLSSYIAPGRGFYGDGSDGDVVLGSDVVLARDTFYETLDLDVWDLDTAGFKLYVADQLTVPAGSRIHADGAGGAGGDAGGGGGSAGVIGTIDSGAAGGAAGAVGTSVTDSMGGDGGSGGAGLTGPGAGGTATEPVAAAGGFHHRNAAQFGAVFSTQAAGGHATTFIVAGAGGGGGGNDGANDGGGGGAGGGFVFVIAHMLDLEGTIGASGGDGGDGETGSNAGGGGGGGGGITVVITDHPEGAGTLAAAAGVGGLGIGTGSDGSAGAAGLVLDFRNGA